MKKILLVAVILCIGNIAIAQKPLKHAKQIVVTLNTEKDQQGIVKDLVSYLTRRGYEIDTYNKDLNLLTTKGKEIKFWHLRLSIFIEDKTLRFTGAAYAEMLGTSSTWTVENKGSLGDVYVNTWREMNEVATGLPATAVNYEL